MSEENVEIARAYLEAWNATSGYPDTSKFRDPRFELHDPPDLPDSTVHVGEEPAGRRVQEYIDTIGWDNKFRVEAYVDAGDEVAVLWRPTVTAPTADLSIDYRFTHVLAIRDGLIWRCRQYFTWEQGLEAAGVDAEQIRALTQSGGERTKPAKPAPTT